MSDGIRLRHRLEYAVIVPAYWLIRHLPYCGVRLLAAVIALVVRAVPGCRAVRWNEAFADIIPADGGKAKGLARMMARHGIQAGACIAFGDGGNDIDMLRAVGIGVAMGNAAPAVQAAADYVTDRVDRDGIWKAAVHFGLIQE